MQRRFVGVTVVVMALAAATACEHKPTATAESGGALGIPTRSAALGDFPDNPMVGLVPASTPYAMVTFKPYPFELTQKFFKAAVPLWRKMFQDIPTSSDNPNNEIMRQDVLWALDHLDLPTIEAQGFTRNARFAIYGLGAYPVVRFELADGGKVFALVQRLAERWHAPLPPPTQRASGHYWQIDLPEASFVIGILAKELVLAAGPKDVIDGQLAQILGEQKPAQAMTAAQLRAIAERDGFSSLGVGFVDMARIADLIAKYAPSPACNEAIAGLARRVPRLTTGYGDVTANKTAFGIVVELAPDVLAEARTLTGKLAGLDRLFATRPAGALAAAADVDKARIAGGHAASVLADLGQRCQLGRFSANMQQAVAALAKPLPPFVGGLHGGYAVVNKVTMGASGPSGLEGFGSIQVDNVSEVIKLVQMEAPTLALPTDGKPHALPAEVAPPRTFAAADARAIGVAAGPTAEADAVRGLAGTPVTAPLLVLAFDYGQIGALMPMPDPAMRDQMKALMGALGRLIAQVLVDDRGVVIWSQLESN